MSSPATGWQASTVFLELLAREAPTIEFERPVLEARTAGATAAQIEELEQARAVALRVRALLPRLHRRCDRAVLRARQDPLEGDRSRPRGAEEGVTPERRADR